MKVKEILLQKEDGSVETRTEFSADEVAVLLQFAFNMAASMGLSAEAKMRRVREQLQAAGKEADDLINKASKH